MSARVPKLRDPATLTPHPLIVSMPRWAKDSDEWRAFVRDIQEHGIREKLKVCGDQVVDGETRRQAAAELGIKVPTEKVSPDEVLGIVLRNLLRRRNVVSKSAEAYLAYPLIQPAHEEARQRHLKTLQTGNRGTKSHAVAFGPKVEDFADSVGVKLTLFKYAAQLHKLFAEDPELKAEFEPSILEDGKGLGAVLAGISSHKATKGNKRGQRDEEQLELFTESWSVLGKRLGYWEKLSVDDRNRAVPELRKTVAAMPESLLKELKLAIQTHEKDLKDAHA